MKPEVVYNKLIEAVGLKVGDKIIRMSIWKYFSKSIAKGRPVKLTYVPEIYQLFKDRNDNYYFRHITEKRLENGQVDTYYSEEEYNYKYPYLLFDNFIMYNEAKYTQKTVEYYPTRQAYYDAYPEQDLVRLEKEFEKNYKE